MKDLQINEGVVDPEDTEMLQDLVIMAVNDALAKIDVETRKTMGKYTKGPTLLIFLKGNERCNIQNQSQS